MNQQYQEQIIQALVSQEGQPIRSAEIADRLMVPQEDRTSFEELVDLMGSAGKIIIGVGRLITLPALGNHVTGTFRQTSRGFGFIIPDEPNAHGDLFIPAGENMDAVTGDYVTAKVVVRDKYDTRERKNVSGRIVEILKRATNKVVGTLSKQNGRWLCIPDGHVFRSPIEVADVSARNGAENDKVVLEIVRYPLGDQLAQGVITEILGSKGEPEVELASVIRQFDLPQKFPEEVLQQARTAATTYDPEAFLLKGDREDLRNELIATIDPDDARDFDDAISLKRLKGASRLDEDEAEPDVEQLMQRETGTAAWELGVHIADVSSFVGVESPMDIEARTRGNSTYFPGYVIPMLPEVLSNGVCSLQENQPRLCKSAFIRYDEAGRVVGTRFANTIIQSKKRLTYKQAQAIIDDVKGVGQPYTKGLLESPPNPNVPVVSEEIRKLLLHMDRLARVIRQRRLQDGMIVLDLPEVELVINEEGHVIDARPEDDSFTHKIIEMFMVEANEAVSRWLTKAGIPVLRRIHPDPDAMDTETVRSFMQVAGRKVPKVLDRKALQGVLDSVRGTPIAYAVSLAVLKTMSSAEYSPQPVGHYALASDNYAHFTSPIRRYADLVIHRCFDAILARKGEGRGAPVKGKKPRRGKPKEDAIEVAEERVAVTLAPPNSGTPGGRRGAGMMPAALGMTPDFGTLVNLGKHIGFTERRSSDAERELRAVKVLQLLAEHIGDLIDGVITGVTGFGVFVQSTRFLVEGMIRVADLPDDFWQFDEKGGCLKGQRTGRRISLGDRARVQIVSINIPARQLDLRLVEHGSSIGGDTAMRRMEPRRPPKVPPGQPTEEQILERSRKKNFVKRQERKDARRSGGHQPTPPPASAPEGGAPGGGHGGGRGKSKRHRRGGRFRR